MTIKWVKPLFLCVVLTLCSIYANAYNFEVDGIYYNVVSSSNLTCEVTYKSSSYDTYSGSVTIPETVKRSSNGYTYTVVGIGSYAFCNSSTSNASLTEVIMPTTVTYIGDYAFHRSAKLKSLTIPNSITSIGDYAFDLCYNLTSIEIPNSVTSIGSSAFENCSSLTSITIPNGVKSIRSSAFQNCSRLTSLIIPDEVTSIGFGAFAYCYGLTTLTIGNSVTSIGQAAFQGCTGLTTLISRNSNPPSCSSNSFSSVPTSTCVLYVQEGCKNTYAKASVWKNFTNIIEIPFETLFVQFVDDVEDLRILLQGAMETINNEYPDVANDFNEEYNLLMDDVDNLYDEIFNAYRNGTIIDKMYEIFDETEEINQNINEMLSAAKEAHEAGTGISNILGNITSEVQIYSLSGTRVTNPIKGNIYIMRYSDGKTQKVIVK